MRRGPILRWLACAAAPLLVAGPAAGQADYWPVLGGAGANIDSEVPVVTTPDGNVLVAGEFTGTLQIGGETPSCGEQHVSAGGTDIFVAKFDGVGQCVWVKIAGGANDDRVFDLDVDDQGRSYVAGSFTGAIRFGSFQLATNPNDPATDGFVASLSGSGSWRWARQIALNQGSQGEAVVDLALAVARPDEPELPGQSPKAASIFVAGQIRKYYCDTSVRLGTGPSAVSLCTPSPGVGGCADNTAQDFRWLARLTPAGEWDWSPNIENDFSTPGVCRGFLEVGRSLDLAAAANGTVYWAFYWQHPTTSAQDEHRIFRYQESEQVPGCQYPGPGLGQRCSPWWGLLLTGSNRWCRVQLGALICPPSPAPAPLAVSTIGLVEADPPSLFLATEAGDIRGLTDEGELPFPWTATMSPAGAASLHRAATDVDGNLLVSGHFDEELTLSSSADPLADLTLTPGSGDTAFMARLNYNGTWLWAQAVPPQGSSGTASGSYEGPPIAIPDFGVVNSVVEIAGDGFVASVEASVAVTHGYIGDLTVDLASPDGVVVRLHNRSGASDNSIDTTYPVPTSPDGPGSMADFAGTPVAGSWTLRVTEFDTEHEAGTLDSWSLAIETTPGQSRGKGIAALGPFGILGGLFQGSIGFGGDVLTSSGSEWNQFASAFNLTTGDPLVPSSVLVGEALAPPDGAMVTLPRVEVNGEDGVPGVTHYWSEVAGRLFLLREGVAEIRWPVTVSPGGVVTSSVVSIAFAKWPDQDCQPVGPPDPETPCKQLHVAGAPVRIGAEGLTFQSVYLPAVGASDARVENGDFLADTEGWSVVRYSRDSDSSDAFEVIRTEARLQANGTPNPVVRTPSPVECIIGTKLTDSWHDQSDKTGYVFNQRAFYDGEGADKAYVRATRTGAIIPVNRVKAARQQDADKAMSVAWYRSNAHGVYWPSRAARYICRWPRQGDASYKKIVIAGQQGTGGEGPDYNPVLFPSVRLYDQPDVTKAGYNPNDEHAFRAPANGTGQYDAFFPLRADFGSEADASEPYLLVKYFDPSEGPEGEWEFDVYKVLVADVDHPDFTQAGVAGSLVQAPYPLSRIEPLCPELTRVEDEAAGDLQPPTPFFRDHKKSLWARAAGSRKVAYFYPMRPGFFIDRDADDVSDLSSGDCLPWMGGLEMNPFASDPASVGTPIDVTYTFAWPVGVPELAAGETLLEAKNGLPDITHQAAVEVVFDQLQRQWLEGTPPTPAGPTYDPTRTLVRLIEPLPARVAALEALPQDIDAELGPDNKLRILGSATEPENRVSPSLGRRLRWSPETHELTLQGLFDDPGSGEPLLVPNVMSQADKELLLGLSGGGAWQSAVAHLFDASRNPRGLALFDPAECEFTTDESLATFVDRASGNAFVCSGARNWAPQSGPFIGFSDPDGNGIADGGRILGPGGALTAGFAQGTGYVTLAFNNDPALGAAPVSLEVIQIGCPVYQGQLHVIQPENVFDEQITLRHAGDFAGNPDALDFEWYAKADVDGKSPPAPDPSDPPADLGGWTRVEECSPAEGPEPNGAVECTIGGTNTRTLEDTWYLARYRGLPVCGNQLSDGAFSPFAGGGSPNPEQRAQLGEGWVKRVLDEINPLEQKVKEFHKTPVDTTASMLSQLGERYEGPVALNSDPANLNRLGLIQIYETILRRAMALSVDAVPPASTPAANGAILLVATRLADFYTLLGNEAYADALDPTIGITTDALSGLGSIASSLFNFQNQAASVLDEELVLLRGRDDSQATTHVRPVYNRFFWNFTTGEGEVAYTTSYNLFDADFNGTIDELDARIQFPQGHGDAWGHYTTALDKHYRLLRHPNYRWSPRPEAVRVAGTPIQVDFLDERKFAQAAAARARAGAEIVDLTYRREYVEDVAGQWQGYKDTDTARAWGVSGWGRRAGMAAYFDWLVGNHILPAVDPDPTHQGIQKIDRETVDELDQIAGFFAQIQGQLDEADRGLNPLGLAKGVVPFDIDPSRVDEGETHFEQVFERTTGALDNAVGVWDFANLLSRQLRRNQDSVEDLQRNTRDSEVAFLSRMKEIFGTPYPDDIGEGKTYDSGYTGPDVWHYEYIDLASIGGKRLDQADLELQERNVSYKPLGNGLGFFFGEKDNPLAGVQAVSDCGSNPFGEGCTFGPLDPEVKAVEYLVWDSPDFGYVQIKPPGWTGQRQITGTIQTARQEIFRAQLALKQGIKEYDNLRLAATDEIDTLKDYFNVRSEQLQIANAERNEINQISASIAALNATALVTRSAYQHLENAANTAAACLPTVVGFSNDVFAPVRCGILTAGSGAGVLSDIADGAEVAAKALDAALADVSLQAAIQTQVLDASLEFGDFIAAYNALIRKEPVLRAEVLQLTQSLQQAQEAYRNELAAGLSLKDELLAFRKNTAAAVQEHRLADLAFRAFLNDALQKYRASFDLAARMSYLAATAYDYDTNLLGSDARAGQTFLTDIVRKRSLGQVVGGEPVPGSRGLSDPIARMALNFEVLKGQMGFNNPQLETTRFSLRREHFGVRDNADLPPACGALDEPGDDACWRETLGEFEEPDLWALQDFRRLARPPRPESLGKLPALVIPFDSTVTFGLNFFGEELAAGDSAYNPTNFSTRVRAVGVWLDGYDELPLSATPQVYLIPVGADVLRAPAAYDFTVREWAVVDQVLPVPFPIGDAELADPDWIPMADTLSGGFGASRRFSSFRAFPFTPALDINEFSTDSRLIGRSVWNRKWLLIIPGGSLLNNGQQGLDCLLGKPGNAMGCAGIRDIRLFFQTYAYSGN